MTDQLVNPIAPPIRRLACSIDEAADALGISKSLVRKLINSGEIRSTKLGARRLIPISALEEFAESLG